MPQWPIRVMVLVSLAAVKAARPVMNVTTALKAAFYINLDRMPSRKQHIEQMLADRGLRARRLSAVDWKQVADGDFDREFVTPQGIVPDLLERAKDKVKELYGTIGCFLSHVGALTQASKELQPDDLALIMEDDVSLPEDWRFRMQVAVEMAPKDWELLKLSGWGSARLEDMTNGSAPISGVKTDRAKPRTMWSKMTRALRSMFSDEVPRVTFFMMREPFTEPSSWGWGTLGFGTKKYYYAGTGAYLVRGSAIQKIIHHLRNQPINDLDAMLLSNGSMRFYEGWPHVFDLSGDAFHGPGLHGRKAFDEFDRGSVEEENVKPPKIPTCKATETATGGFCKAAAGAGTWTSKTAGAGDASKPACKTKDGGKGTTKASEGSSAHRTAVLAGAALVLGAVIV